MSMFAGASNIVINEGHFVAQSLQAPKDLERERHALQRLERHVALGAVHNSRERRDAPKCLPRTREAVFREISEWIHDFSDEKPVLWLYGPAGAGKSAIAQSVAEKVYQQEIEGCLLVATFFFNRSNGERNNADRLIPSLAYQMISSVPASRKFIVKAIVDNPHIFSLNLRTQLEKLVIRPLISTKVARSLSGLSRMLIIVDGLDECQESEERTEFIQAVSESLGAIDPGIHLIFLCHSRPESDIRNAFNSPQTSHISARIVLDNRFDPDSDIRALLDHDFAEIKRVHPLRGQLPGGWPAESALQNLVRKSSGQFIYASTVMKYITSRRHIPMKRLEVVLHVGSDNDTSPFKELDALYRLVLSSIDEDECPVLLRIIGMICFPDLFGEVFITPQLLDDVLGLDSGTTLLMLDDLHSLIDVGLDDPKAIDIPNRLKPFHASFGDFLRDRSRSDEYHVDLAVVEADCALAYFKAQFYAITNSSTKYRVVEQPSSRRQFHGKLTVELSKFFRKFPWRSLVELGLPARVTYPLRRVNWMRVISQFYDFCKLLSGVSSRWARITKRASVEMTAWLAAYLRLLSSKSSETICFIQDELRFCYIYQLLDLDHDLIRNWHFDPTFGNFIITILRTKLPGIEPISRQQRGFAIFDTILEGFVTGFFLTCSHDGRYYWLYRCKNCIRSFVCLIKLADRASCIDALLSYPKLREKLSSASSSVSSLTLDIAEAKAAIATYKKKPIPDDYDYDFQLDPSIDELREMHKQQCKARRQEHGYKKREGRDIKLSEVQVGNFNLLENSQTT